MQGFSRKILNDRHKYLIAMLQGVQNGYNLPESITPEEYRYIRDHKDEDPALAGFVGFGCSFGGKWFGGYARNASGTNYALQSKRSLLKDMATLQDAHFVCEDYRRVCIPPGAVIYADPPYNNTTGYSGERFDSSEFWRAMRLLADTGHTVFVSEQEAPPGIECIWEKPFTRTLDTMVLWTLYQCYGWREKRLHDFYLAMAREHRRMREYYQMDDLYPERYKLKEKGIDVEKWQEEVLRDDT